MASSAAPWPTSATKWRERLLDRPGGRNRPVSRADVRGAQSGSLEHGLIQVRGSRAEESHRSASSISRKTWLLSNWSAASTWNILDIP